MQCEYLCHPKLGPIHELSCRYTTCKDHPNSDCCSKEFGLSPFIDRPDVCVKGTDGKWQVSESDLRKQTCYMNTPLQGRISYGDKSIMAQQTGDQMGMGLYTISPLSKKKVN